MIEIKALSCGYGKRDVINRIDLNLNDGELAGILGPNGSGKSTLILSLSGVLSYRSGNIKVAGEEIARTTARWRARQMASVPQKSELTFPFKCLSVVLMGRYPYLPQWGGYSKEDMDKALDAMEQTDTIQFAQRMITEVSGGEAQRVIIARALAQETGILLLDEATSSLDVAKKIQIFDLLKRKNTQGTTLLCAMHDLNLAALYCKRLIFLKDGRIVLDGSTHETFTDKNLSGIYETDVRVSKHPVTGSPQAHFVPGQEDRIDHADHGSDSPVESSRLGDTDC
jgi:iron complex transport system ATP-binding protein